MKPFLTTIKYDYFQRTRSYAFLITLCASLAIAYTFVPEPNANYSTINIANHIGYYNSAWFGYVTATMTTIFLSLIGFYLVNNSIKKDINTKVGQIVSTTLISNFKYLFSKVISNFLVLLTIVCIVFLMSILLFLLYNDGFPFEPFQFIKPYALVTIPAMFFISVVGVVFEVFLGKYSVLQNVVFFFFFSSLIVFTPKDEIQFALDVFGSKIVTHQMEQEVRELLQDNESLGLNIGYTIKSTNTFRKFNFNGVNFPISFSISRLLWMLSGIGIIILISPFFHRFNLKERKFVKKEKQNVNRQNNLKDIVLLSLPKAKPNYAIFPLLKTEVLLLIRKGKKWLWFLNGIGMILLVTLPLEIAHQMVLPVLWFLQVHRLSDITTKEYTNNMHYFAFSCYKPISRLLLSQLVSAIILILFLVVPLLVRFIILGEIIAFVSVIFGGIFIVLFAAVLGVLTKGKKLFEILFFMVTYANINKIPFLDYFGGMHQSLHYILIILAIIGVGVFASMLVRSYELKKM